MRKVFLISMLSLIMTSCSKSFIQVFDTATNNTELKGGFYVFEDENVKITYSFWANKGLMSFAVYNKLDRPIYIDWKNSSFIYNDNKLNYWIEETKTNSTGYYGGYFYNGPLIKPGYTLSDGVQQTYSATVKPERITFIPPKSNYYRTQFYLLPLENYNITSKSQTHVVPRNDKPNKNTKIYFENFSSENSPLRFRNYLAFSLSENSDKFLFVDNSFYLQSVKEMDIRNYEGKVVGSKWGASLVHETPYKKMTSFYIDISKHKSFEYRKKNGQLK